MRLAGSDPELRELGGCVVLESRLLTPSLSSWTDNGVGRPV